MIELPPIINRRQFDNDQDFIEKAYETFIHDFVEYPPTFLNKKVACLPYKTTDGKYFNTFWHVITEGDHRESDRFVQERIERIPWIRPIIDEQPDKDWYVWDKPLKRKNHRVHIYSTKRKYLVVLDLRGEDRVVFWTAFPIDPDNHHQEKKLLKEYSLYKLF